MFGIYTKADDSSVAESQIRLGGYNSALFASGANHDWFDTSSGDSWVIDVFQIHYWNLNFLTSQTTALINPGFQYIGAPLAEFR